MSCLLPLLACAEGYGAEANCGGDTDPVDASDSARVTSDGCISFLFCDFYDIRAIVSNYTEEMLMIFPWSRASISQLLDGTVVSVVDVGVASDHTVVSAELSSVVTLPVNDAKLEV